MPDSLVRKVNLNLDLTAHHSVPINLQSHDQLFLSSADQNSVNSLKS